MSPLKLLLVYCALLCSFSSNAQDLIKNAQKGLKSLQSKSDLPHFELFKVDREKSNVEFSPFLSHYVSLNMDKSLFKNIKQNKASGIQMEIPVNDSNSFFIELQRANIHSNKFLRATRERNDLKSLKTFSSVFYQGNIAGDADSKVALSVHNDYIKMLIIDKNGTYNLLKTKGSESYILYNDNERYEKIPFECQTDLSHLIGGRDNSKQNNELKSAQVGECVSIYIEADYDLYQQLGSSVSNVENYASDLVNAASVIYEFNGQVILLHLDSVHVHQTSDPFVSYTQSNQIGALLQEFGFLTQDNTSASLNHLLIGRQLGSPGYSGLGWIDVLCVGYLPPQQAGPYAVSTGINRVFSDDSIVPPPTYSWEVQVFTHEMGHNFGSLHTHDCVWGPNGDQKLDDCASGGNSNCTTVGSPPHDKTIMSYCWNFVNDTIYQDFSLGFGQEPWDEIYSNYTAANCTSVCPASCSFTPPITLNNSTPKCSGNNVEFDISFTPDGASGNYSIFVDNMLVHSIMNAAQSGTVNVNFMVSLGFNNNSTIKVEDTDDSNCEIELMNVVIPDCTCSISYPINISPAPTCNGFNVDFGITFTATNSTGPYNVNLGGMNLGNIATTTASFTVPSTAGTPTLLVTDITNPTCSSSASVTIPDCPTCNDGVQNQGEAGVDCGGPCPACPTCVDGIQNGDEAGVDCGGSNCALCNCTDVNLTYNNETIANGTDKFVDDWILTTGTVDINNGSTVKLRAGMYIELMPGFEIKVNSAGSVLIDIEPCNPN